MADVIQLSDGTTTIDLYFDTSGFRMKSDGNEFGVADHDNVLHAPINRDGEVIVRHRLENKEWPVALAVAGDDKPELALGVQEFTSLRISQAGHDEERIYFVFCEGGFLDNNIGVDFAFLDPNCDLLGLVLQTEKGFLASSLAP